MEEKEKLDIADIRNQLSPITCLLSLIDENIIGTLNDNKELDEIFKNTVKACKDSVAYLSQRELYNSPKEFVVTNVYIKEGRGGGLRLEFVSLKNLKNDTLLKLKSNKGEAFEIAEVKIENGLYKYSVKEIGYWASLLKNENDLDIMSLIGKEFDIVIDKHEFDGIHKRSCYC